MSEFLFDVFISYNWNIKEKVRLLYKKLTSEFGLRVWLDEKEIANSNLFREISDGIVKSSIFLCCVTKAYAESDNCVREITLAATEKKPMLVLMFENLKMNELGDVGFIINPIARFNCYQENSFLTDNSNHIFECLIKAIEKCLGSSLRTNEQVLTFPNGDRYEGEVLFGLANGKGTMHFASGEVYTGEWSNGKINGRGVLKYPETNSIKIFVGVLRDGKKEGLGTEIMKDETRYEGEFLNDKRHGKGVLTYKNSQKFQCEYQNGEIISQEKL